MVTTVDPLDKRCEELIHFTSIARGMSRENIRIDASANSPDMAVHALRNYVRRASDAIRKLELAVPPFMRSAPMHEAMNSLLTLKAPDLVDLVDEALIAALKADEGQCKIATFHAEMGKRNLAVIMVPPHN